MPHTHRNYLALIEAATRRRPLMCTSYKSTRPSFISLIGQQPTETSSGFLAGLQLYQTAKRSRAIRGRCSPPRLSEWRREGEGAPPPALHLMNVRGRCIIPADDLKVCLKSAYAFLRAAHLECEFPCLALPRLGIHVLMVRALSQGGCISGTESHQDSNMQDIC